MSDSDEEYQRRIEAMRRQSEQIRRYRKIANDHGYCGEIVYSYYGDVEGPCAEPVGHSGRCRP